MLKYVKLAKDYALHPALTIGGTAITIALIIGACVKAVAPIAELKSEFVRYRAKLKYQSAE